MMETALLRLYTAVCPLRPLDSWRRQTTPMPFAQGFSPSSQGRIASVEQKQEQLNPRRPKPLLRLIPCRLQLYSVQIRCSWLNGAS